MTLSSAWALDQNGNGQSDVWEMVHRAPGLAAGGDADGDGFSNAAEAGAGTDPVDPWSFPALTSEVGGGRMVVRWHLPSGKTGRIFTTPDLVSGWQPMGTAVLSAGWPQEAEVPFAAPRGFFRLQAGDVDTDADGLSDFEEGLIGFEPTQAHSGRHSQLDLARATAGLTGTNQLTISVYDDTLTERWPDPGVFVLRRGGTGLQPLTVEVSFGGTATRTSD